MDDVSSVHNKLLFQAQRCNPPVSIEIETYRDAKTEKDCVIAKVPKSERGIHRYEKVYYSRYDSLTLSGPPLAPPASLESFSRLGDDLGREIRHLSEQVDRLQEALRDPNRLRQGATIFVSHGRHPETRDRVSTFLEALGLSPLAVVDSPSQDRSVLAKVEGLLARAQGAVVIMTSDEEVKGEGWKPRQNVVHEIGLLQRLLPGRIVYLRERSVIVPSNIAEKAYLSFDSNRVEETFAGIVTEFRSMGLL